ncbi:MAG: hypothetical protein K0R39_1136 [Symbiobacteriaceae bacterium]|jgi:hypothetical protein|nr:hypothetical protein [Symbiobacteriaceae bacterium]
MEKDQLEKMIAHAEGKHSEEMFLLSWTLTFQDWTNIFDGSLEGISKPASARLGQFLAGEGHGYPVNILYVDFLPNVRVTDCAILLNR